MSWSSRCASAAKATTQSVPSPFSQLAPAVTAPLKPPVVAAVEPLTSHSLGKNRVLGSMSISSGIGVSTQVRYAHTDTIKVPDFGPYRRNSVKSPVARNKDSAEKRKLFNYVVTGGLSVMGMYSAKTAVHTIVGAMAIAKDALAVGKVEIDLNSIKEGKSVVCKWRGKPLFIRHRTAAEIKDAESVDQSSLRHAETDQSRVKDPKWLIVLGICTHLGCVPIANKGMYNGYYCPCHGSHYDTSGRIRKGPAPLNLEVPPYEFTSSTVVTVG